MAYPHYRSQFGDTTFTKVFVGGLAWETPTDEMRRYFEQFGEILEAVIITDKNTGKSKGYGFVSSLISMSIIIAVISFEIFFLLILIMNMNRLRFVIQNRPEKLVLIQTL